MIMHCSSNHLNLEMEAESLMKKLLYILEFKYLSAIALLYPPFFIDDSGAEFHAA